MEKRRMVLVLAIILSVLIGAGQCSKEAKPDYYYDADSKYVEITAPYEQCVLYRVLGMDEASVYKHGLFAVNYAALKAGQYTGEEAILKLEDLQAEILRVGATVGSVVTMLSEIVAEASRVAKPEIILITESLLEHKHDPTLIDDCTRFKLVKYIAGQKNLAESFSTTME